MASGCRPTGRAAAWRRSMSAALAALGLVLVAPAPARATWRDPVPPDWESAAWSAWQAAGQLTTQPALSSWGAGRRDLGAGPPGRVRARQRRRALAPLVGRRHGVARVGGPRRPDRHRAGGGRVGAQPARRVRKGGRPGALAPLVGRLLVGAVGA